MAGDLAISCAAFFTLLFLFPRVLFARPIRAQNRNIKQD
jgi:hypothetical protein